MFTDKEKAIDCVTYLFSKRFDDTDGLTNNPFSGMDESEQDTTTLHKTSSIIDGVERIEGFTINDWYAPCDLDVSIEEKELDMGESGGISNLILNNMKLQISFAYNNTKYQYTINETDIDYKHYDDCWDWWIGENSNELNRKGYIDKDDENEMVFEIVANKHFRDENDTNGIITGEDMFINVYENNYEDNYYDVIYDVEVLYA